MTEQINTIVLHLKNRFTEIHSQLVAERAQNDSLKNEVSQLIDLMQSKENDVFNLEEKKLLLEQKVLKMQNEMLQLNEIIESQNSALPESRDAEINDLVREIEHCISHLKQ
jgi:cell division protein FtsL